MKKIALYDVDYTILSVNSMFSLFIYSIQKKPFIIFFAPLLIIFFLFWLIGILPVNILKSVWIYPIKSLDKKSLEEYSREFVKRFLFPKIKKGVKQNINSYKKNGYLIIFATASYEFYIKYLAEYLKADYYFGTIVDFDSNGIFPKITGKNCRGKEKISRILEKLPIKKIDRKNSIGFSDSVDDRPFLGLVNKLCIVNGKKWLIKKEIKI